MRAKAVTKVFVASLLVVLLLVFTAPALATSLGYGSHIIMLSTDANWAGGKPISEAYMILEDGAGHEIKLRIYSWNWGGLGQGKSVEIWIDGNLAYKWNTGLDPQVVYYKLKLGCDKKLDIDVSYSMSATGWNNAAELKVDPPLVIKEQSQASLIKSDKIMCWGDPGGDPDALGGVYDFKTIALIAGGGLGALLIFMGVRRR